VAAARFAIDAFSRQCLLEGLDEIDYTLAQLAAIEAFENRTNA
jgi:3-isopropylmalate/(R)-2-methylmalate dehydratase small subunit